MAKAKEKKVVKTEKVKPVEITKKIDHYEFIDGKKQAIYKK